jgi:hypothetical protein
MLDRLIFWPDRKTGRMNSRKPSIQRKLAEVEFTGVNAAKGRIPPSPIGLIF